MVTGEPPHLKRSSCILQNPEQQHSQSHVSRAKETPSLPLRDTHRAAQRFFDLEHLTCRTTLSTSTISVKAAEYVAT